MNRKIPAVQFRHRRSYMLLLFLLSTGVINGQEIKVVKYLNEMGRKACFGNPGTYTYDDSLLCCDFDYIKFEPVMEGDAKSPKCRVYYKNTQLKKVSNISNGLAYDAYFSKHGEDIVYTVYSL